MAQPSYMLQVSTPPALAQAVRIAAARDCTSMSNFVRSTLLKELRASGLDPTTLQTKGE